MHSSPTTPNHDLGWQVYDYINVKREPEIYILMASIFVKFQLLALRLNLVIKNNLFLGCTLFLQTGCCVVELAAYTGQNLSLHLYSDKTEFVHELMRNFSTNSIYQNVFPSMFVNMKNNSSLI